MKHLYSNVKAVLTALFFLGTLNLSAQNYTTVAPANSCNTVEDFNTTAGSFHSPSIFSETTYTEFRWDSDNGYWTEQSGQQSRRGGLVSGVYSNEQPSGGLDIGFRYVAGAGGEYRIRVIKVDCSCVGGSDVIATTASGEVWTPFPSSQGRLCVRLNDADIVRGQKVRFEISFRNNVQVDWVFDDFSLGEVAASPLPVTFMGFVADRNANNDVLLKWDVAEEVNVKEYQVERSSNGGTFTTAGTVSAQNKPVYSFKEISKDNGTVFYRVKSVDFDGRSKYSSIVKLKGEEVAASNSLRIYPMPARSEVTLEHKKLTADAQVTISTMDGRIIKSLKPVVGATHTPVVLNGMLPGLYLVRLQDGNGPTETVKLVKQ